MEYVEPIRDKTKIELVKSILKKNGTRDYLLFLLGINCGLRISDILNLKVTDVLNKFNHSSPSVTLRYIGINQDIIDKILNAFGL